MRKKKGQKKRKEKKIGNTKKGKRRKKKERGIRWSKRKINDKKGKTEDN